MSRTALLAKWYPWSFGRPRFAGLVEDLDFNLTGVLRAQFARQGRTAQPDGRPIGSTGSAHPLG